MTRRTFIQSTEVIQLKQKFYVNTPNGVLITKKITKQVKVITVETYEELEIMLDGQKKNEVDLALFKLKLQREF